MPIAANFNEDANDKDNGLTHTHKHGMNQLSLSSSPAEKRKKKGPRFLLILGAVDERSKYMRLWPQPNRQMLWLA